jgi:tetratricopeptide (TPR) repeat protein
MRTLLLLLSVGVAWGDGNKEVARGYFQAGVALYDQGRYEEALNEFQRAQAISHNAELYFNMAACEEHMDHYQAAALLLKQYLLEQPEAPDKDNVEQRVKALEQRDLRLHRPEESPPIVYEKVIERSPPAPPPPPKKKIGRFIALGVTAVLGIGTIAIGSFTVVHHGELKSGCGATVAGCTPNEIASVTGPAIGTDVMIGLTAAAAVATVVLFVVEHKKPKEMRVGWAF